MSTSEAVEVRAVLAGSGPACGGFRYVSARNFRGSRSFSARETVIDTAAWITSIPARVAAGLGREVSACQC
ncbi:hypothetical protein GCM10009845_00730 [Pedococcus bigeumensis]|jgi:hypothetical protein